MTNTRQTPMYPGTMQARLEDQMTSYELLAAERSAAIQNQAAHRARLVTQLEAAPGHRPLHEASRSRRLRVRLGVALMAAGTSIAGTTE
ncbi:MAG: hypothetical protein M3452_09395 [Chloroflexota bacterium]|nr:hypothetical protein [Chloroflexota bacterium]